MSTGWAKIVHKAPMASIPVKTRTWTPLVRFDAADLGGFDLGPAVLEDELYANLPATKPANIRQRWVRIGAMPDDPTKRTGLVVGTGTEWSENRTGLEYLTLSDFPLELQLWHDAAATFSVHTVIAAIYAPGVYAAGRLIPGDE